MKKRGVKVLIVTVALVVVGAFVLVGYMRRPQPSFAEAVQFIRKLGAFNNARAQRGQPPAASVELRELVEGGYITAKDARRFGGSTITFSSAAKLDTPQDAFRPQEPLIRVQLRDGRKIVMSVDGSAELLAR
jgi:hypothetical protein